MRHTDHVGIMSRRRADATADPPALDPVPALVSPWFAGHEARMASIAGKPLAYVRGMAPAQPPPRHVEDEATLSFE